MSALWRNAVMGRAMHEPSGKAHTGAPMSQVIGRERKRERIRLMRSAGSRKYTQVQSQEERRTRAPPRRVSPPPLSLSFEFEF